MGKPSCLPQGSQKHPIVELEAFTHSWDVSHAELAQICECDITTVEQWFLDPAHPDRSSPSLTDKQKLAEVHYLWRLERDWFRADKLRSMYYQRPRAVTPGGVGHG